MSDRESTAAGDVTGFVGWQMFNDVVMRRPLSGNVYRRPPVAVDTGRASAPSAAAGGPREVVPAATPSARHGARAPREKGNGHG